MNIIVIAGHYFPTPSPTGICARQICDYLKKKHNITLLCVQKGEPLSGYDTDGIKIYTIPSMDQPSSKLGNIYSSHIYFPYGLRCYTESAVALLDQLYEKWKIDAVLSICAPFSAHVAGYRFTRKHPEIRFVTYTADPYSANLVQNCSKMTRGYKCRRAKKWEKKIYGSSQCNLVFEGIAADEETYSMFPAHNSHLLYYQFPEFFPRTLSEETIKMKIIYAGGFYPTIRNPEYALKTFCGIKNFAFELNIYCNDASAQLVKNCCVLPENIKLHKQVSLDEIRRIMKNADVLLNIGNAIKGYMPSKIFEYIACGKPIISFYTNGLKEQRFDRYPLAIQISQDDTSLEQASQFVEDFCRQFGKKQMNKEEIDLYFPQNLPEKFQYILDNVFGVSV